MSLNDSSAVDKKANSFPWEHPKSVNEDPQALKQTELIIQSPSYIIAEEDTSFLQQHETLGLRLDLDYLKAELLLEHHGIKQTVVVFGSTRIIEEKTAKSQLQKAKKSLQKSPKSTKKIKAVKTAKRILKKSRFYTIAREFGQLVGRAGNENMDARTTLMTGGGPGIMEAANRGAFDVGAKSIGLNISLPHEQFPNPYITPELCFQFHYFAIRKLHFLQRARALVVFPGGFGTVDELFNTLTLIQTGKIDPLPIVLVGQKYWKQLINIDFMEEEGVIASEDRSIFSYAESAEEIFKKLLEWHQHNKTSLF